MDAIFSPENDVRGQWMRPVVYYAFIAFVLLYERRRGRVHERERADESCINPILLTFNTRLLNEDIMRPSAWLMSIRRAPVMWSNDRERVFRERFSILYIQLLQSQWIRMNPKWRQVLLRYNCNDWIRYIRPHIRSQTFKLLTELDPPDINAFNNLPRVNTTRPGVLGILLVPEDGAHARLFLNAASGSAGGLNSKKQLLKKKDRDHRNLFLKDQHVHGSVEDKAFFTLMEWKTEHKPRPADPSRQDIITVGHSMLMHWLQALFMSKFDRMYARQWVVHFWVPGLWTYRGANFTDPLIWTDEEDQRHTATKRDVNRQKEGEDVDDSNSRDA